MNRLAIALIAALAGCADLAPYVAVDAYPDPPDPAAYVIAPGDVINVRVYNQDAVSSKVKVRPDGKVSLPFLNDVQAVGYTPYVLGQQIQTRLKDYINVPVVTVSLEEAHAVSVSVLGEVAKPGQYQLDGTPGVLQAVAAAGGLTDFAHRDRLFVLREQPAPVRIRFGWNDLIHDVGKGPRFRLKDHDVLVVE